MDEAAPPTKPGAWTVRRTKSALLCGSIAIIGSYVVLLAVTLSLAPASTLWAHVAGKRRIVVAPRPSLGARLSDYLTVPVGRDAPGEAEGHEAVRRLAQSSLSLDRKTAQMKWSSGEWYIGPSTRLWVQAHRSEGAVTRLGQLLRFWSPRDWWLYDATGNRTKDGWWEFRRAD